MKVDLRLGAEGEGILGRVNQRSELRPAEDGVCLACRLVSIVVFIHFIMHKIYSNVFPNRNGKVLI